MVHSGHVKFSRYSVSNRGDCVGLMDLNLLQGSQPADHRQ